MDKHQASETSATRPTDANQATIFINPLPLAPHHSEPSTLDPPPSYTEAMSHPIVEPGNQSSLTPSAPPLEGNTTSTYPYNPYVVQGHPAQQFAPSPYAQTDGQFSAWDDRATRILMTRRLEMEERFRRAQSEARSQQEQDILWNLILADLYMNGYHNFILEDLVQFWAFQFHIYKSIVDGLSSGSHTDTSWQYFEPMDNAFKGSTDVLSPTATIGSSILDHDHDIVPQIPVQPLAMPATTSTIQPVTDGATTTVNVSDINNSTLTSSATIGGGDNPISTTLPIVEANETVNENIPLLMPTDGVGDGAAAAVASPADNAASGLTDLGSIQVALTSEPTGPTILNDVTSASAITAQPDSLSKILTGDGDVVTTQPFSMELPSTVQPLEPIDDNNDGCCDNDGCCGDDGCCDDGSCGDGCCGDGDCGGCDGCDDCDCDC